MHEEIAKAKTTAIVRMTNLPFWCDNSFAGAAKQ